MIDWTAFRGRWRAWGKTGFALGLLYALLSIALFALTFALPLDTAEVLLWIGIFAGIPGICGIMLMCCALGGSKLPTTEQRKRTGPLVIVAFLLIMGGVIGNFATMKPPEPQFIDNHGARVSQAEMHRLLKDPAEVHRMMQEPAGRHLHPLSFEADPEPEHRHDLVRARVLTPIALGAFLMSVVHAPRRRKPGAHLQTLPSPA